MNTCVGCIARQQAHLCGFMDTPSPPPEATEDDDDFDDNDDDEDGDASFSSIDKMSA